MAIQTISRIQNRRGLYADLPSQLAEGELGWCLDTRQLFIGNSDGYGGNSEILTAYSQNADLITTIYNNSGVQLAAAAVRTLSSKVDDIASVKDFGATGDGTTDDAPAINAAIASLLENYPTNGLSAASLYMPAGTYLINSPILLYPYLNLLGDSEGGTVILSNNNLLSVMLESADSLGQTGANIGLNNATLPTRIRVADVTISTNGAKINAVDLVRYSHVRFERVKFQGGWTNGDGLLTDVAVTLQSIGTAVTTYDAQFVDCEFTNFTNGIFANDPVAYTTIARCTFKNLYRGMALGSTPAYQGPSYTTVSQSYFYQLDNYNIFVGNSSTNPGVTSTSNSFNSDGYNVGGYHIFWGTGTQFNASIGDVFDVLPAISDNSSYNLILNAQLNNLISGAVLKPFASSPPSVNGGLSIVATSNTQLTFQLKGTDGIIRSGSITLS